MILRSRPIRLGSGIEFETPLIVPGLSSTALAPLLYPRTPTSKPKPTACSIVHSQSLIAGIGEALLVSAYDIHHRLLTDYGAFYARFAQSRYSQPKVLIIDSGWYEKNGNPAGSAFSEGQDHPLEWTEEMYEALIDRLSQDMCAVVVSWDRPGTYEQQISKAQKFFGVRSRFSSCILLKHPKNSRFHDFDKLSGESTGDLRAFDVVGVAEKELGETIIDRLVNLATLRLRLNEKDVTAPIHVFGGLDPLYTPLYFAAGGEIFDGLGWLRYAYRDGVAVNRDAVAVLDGQVSRRWMQTLLTVSLENLSALSLMVDDLRKWAHRGDWSKVSTRGEALQRVYEQFEERMDNGRGGRHGR